MKKVLTILVSAIFIYSGICAVKAATLEELIGQQTPLAVLVYADWADDYKSYIDAFKTIENTYGDALNYFELNIASKDTKYFNQRYHIYPNLPYILLFRDNGKVSRYVQKECVLDESCLQTRVKSFTEIK